MPSNLSFEISNARLICGASLLKESVVLFC